MLPPSLQDSLPAGWLSLYREGVEPSGSLQKVSDHPSSFSGLSLAQGKFHFEPPSASHHSITSSARSRIAVGSSMPIALAVLRLTTSSNFVACSTGSSAAFAPLQIFATYSAARRYIPEKSAP